MSVFSNLLKKEWLDALRDKRAFGAAMLIALMGPFMFVMMFNVMVDRMKNGEPLQITIEGAEHFPSLVTALERQKIYDKDRVTELSLEDKPSKTGITLTIDSEMMAKLEKSETGTITLSGDFSEQERLPQLRRIRGVISSFSAEIVGMRLMVRGISPSIANPIEVVQKDFGIAQMQAVMLLGTIVAMLFAAVFASSTNVAIDCSAGERERNSLEFLAGSTSKNPGFGAGENPQYGVFWHDWFRAQLDIDSGGHWVFASA